MIHCGRGQQEGENIERRRSMAPSWRTIITPGWVNPPFFLWKKNQCLFPVAIPQRSVWWRGCWPVRILYISYMRVVDRQRVFDLSSTFHLRSPLSFVNINKFLQYPSSVGVIFPITNDKLGSKHSQGNCPRVPICHCQKKDCSSRYLNSKLCLDGTTSGV